MCFFFSLMPATFWAVVGYFVYFLSTRTEGGAGQLGRVLAIWAFVISAAILLFGAYLTLSGMCSVDGFCSMSGFCNENVSN